MLAHRRLVPSSIFQVALTIPSSFPFKRLGGERDTVTIKYLARATRYRIQLVVWPPSPCMPAKLTNVDTTRNKENQTWRWDHERRLQTNTFLAGVGNPICWSDVVKLVYCHGWMEVELLQTTDQVLEFYFIYLALINQWRINTIIFRSSSTLAKS